MKVKQLIEILEKQDPESVVCVHHEVSNHEPHTFNIEGDKGTAYSVETATEWEEQSCIKK